VRDPSKRGDWGLIGTGQINMADLYQALCEANVPWAVVEQDAKGLPLSPDEVAAACIYNLAAHGWARRK